MSSVITIDRPERLAPPPVRAIREPTRPRIAERLDDWPRTRRPLPWVLAAFIAMTWLVPFDTISLSVSLPFQLHLDRIVLPFIVLGWGLSFVLAGRRQPKLRITPIHVAAGAFMLLALASVVLNATSLNDTLELKNAIKQIILFGSYFAFFVVVASSIRPTEVRAFMTFVLGLAVVCGIGLLWEYRFHYNPFYGLTAQLLPHSVFDVAPMPATGFDEMGRRIILGPAELDLEAAAMMAMAVPLALVALFDAPTRRKQLLYGVVCCIVLAAGLATFRKTSIVVPGAIFVLIVAIRPRRAGRLVPLILVLFIGAHFLAPGAIGSVIKQLSGSHLTSVDTTQHRTDGYDTIRPLVWSHPAFGQGLGSYTNLDYILDNQILGTLVEMGLLGLGAYIAVMISVVKTAVPMIRGSGPYSSIALAGALSAVAFFVLSFLFDEMSFPHVPYIFLTVAGLVAAAVRGRAEGSGADGGADDAPTGRFDRRLVVAGAKASQTPIRF